MNELEKKFRLDLDEKAQSFLDDQNAIYFRNGANWAFQWFSRQQQWIPVTERLPEPNTKVVVLADRIMAISEVASYPSGGPRSKLTAIDKSRRWSFFPGCGDNKITHWMPLPEPPK